MKELILNYTLFYRRFVIGVISIRFTLYHSSSLQFSFSLPPQSDIRPQHKIRLTICTVCTKRNGVPCAYLEHVGLPMSIHLHQPLHIASAYRSISRLIFTHTLLLSFHSRAHPKRRLRSPGHPIKERETRTFPSHFLATIIYY